MNSVPGFFKVLIQISVGVLLRVYITMRLTLRGKTRKQKQLRAQILLLTGQQYNFVDERRHVTIT